MNKGANLVPFDPQFRGPNNTPHWGEGDSHVRHAQGRRQRRHLRHQDPGYTDSRHLRYERGATCYQAGGRSSDQGRVAQGCSESAQARGRPQRRGSALRGDLRRDGSHPQVGRAPGRGREEGRG